VALCKCSSTGRLLGAYNLGVATPKALVYAGLMTSRDATSCVCHAALVVLHDALRALVDMLLVAMLIKDVSLVAMLVAFHEALRRFSESDSEREGSEDEGPDFEEEEKEAAPKEQQVSGGLIHDQAQRLDALPPTLFEGYDRDFRELYTRSRAVRDEIFSQRYRLRSLEQERATVTFSAIWRPVLALESWAGRVDALRAMMSQARSEDHRLIHDLLVQNAAMQHELQELRDRVTTLEWERDHRG
ncbi:hypothetical protein Tco_0847946, partial [Tanacetum coccineum]